MAPVIRYTPINPQNPNPQSTITVTSGNTMQFPSWKDFAFGDVIVQAAVTVQQSQTSVTVGQVACWAMLRDLQTAMPRAIDRQRCKTLADALEQIIRSVTNDAPIVVTFGAPKLDWVFGTGFLGNALIAALESNPRRAPQFSKPGYSEIVQPPMPGIFTGVFAFTTSTPDLLATYNLTSVDRRFVRGADGLLYSLKNQRVNPGTAMAILQVVNARLQALIASLDAALGPNVVTDTIASAFANHDANNLAWVHDLDTAPASASINTNGSMSETGIVGVTIWTDGLPTTFLKLSDQDFAAGSRDLAVYIENRTLIALHELAHIAVEPNHTHNMAFYSMMRFLTHAAYHAGVFIPVADGTCTPNHYTSNVYFDDGWACLQKLVSPEPSVLSSLPPGALA